MNQLFGLQHRSRTDPVIPRPRHAGASTGADIHVEQIICRQRMAAELFLDVWLRLQ